MPRLGAVGGVEGVPVTVKQWLPAWPENINHSMPDDASEIEALHRHPHPACLTGEQLLRQCQAGHSRAGGPGGQHRNKVQTAITLLHLPTGIEGSASERRSQQDNHRMALRRLRLNLALHLRIPMAATHRPSDLWLSRTRDGAVVVSPSHTDFPAMLAEALDVIAGSKFDVPAAATKLQCNTSQLVKLLRGEPKALAWVNAQRGARGLRKLL